MSKTVSRLYDKFQPSHYAVTWDLDLANSRADGQVIIKGKKTGRPSRRISLHAKYLQVTSATITYHDKKAGDRQIVVQRINLHQSYDEVRLHTADNMFAGEYTLQLSFSAPIQDSMHGIYRSTYLVDGQEMPLISTQFESHHAREAMPCVDEPEAKATFDVTISAPEALGILGNMPASQQNSSGGRQTVSFATSPRMSVYLLAFVAGDLHSRTVTTAEGVEVAVWATKNHSAEALDFAADCGKRCIEFFNSYYGTPYPLPKCDMVAIPDFSSGAMENWGLVTYRETCLIADPQTATQQAKEVVALVVCHELSHQWFGNLVTMKWWDDLWLNESFANVMEYVAVDALYPEWRIFNSFAANEGLSAFRRDSIAGVQPIKTAVNHPDEISTLFDPSIVYAKGGRLLNMLRTYVGETAFRAGLKQYFAEHQYSNTTGADLWTALSKASGKDVAGFMEPWLQQPGFPLVSVDQNGNQLAISQQHFTIDPAKADPDRRWPVPTLAGTHDVPSLLQEASLRAELGSSDYTRLNQGAVGHYIVQYVQPAHADWLASLAANQSLDETERLMLLSDSSMLARSGAQSLVATLKLMENYRQESSEPVWDIMSLVMADSRRFIDQLPELEDAIKAQIRQLIEVQYQRLGWQVISGEPSQDTKLRASIIGLGAYAEHPQIKQRVMEMFDEYKQDANSVDSEFRGIVFASAVRYGDQEAFDYLLKLEEQASNPNLKQELMGALTVTRKSENGQRLLGRLKDSKKVRQHDVDHWLVLLLRNRYCQADAWQWLRDNWPWITKTFAGDKSYDSYPRYAASAFNTRSRLEEYREFFGPMTGVAALSRNIAMGIEELEARVAWIERDSPALQEYFLGS